MASNTTSFSLNTDLNVSPYYDDFDYKKGFHRILFNPGRAVQARELTQMQTILQKQIDRFGEWAFKEGSLVSDGQFNIDLKVPFIKIRDADYLNANVNVANFANTTITGANSGVVAIVLDYADGEENTDPDTKTLFIKYMGNGGANNTVQSFIVGEKLVANNGISANVISSNTAIGYGSKFTIDPGIMFAKDHFIFFDKQSIYLEKYSNIPSCLVGFNVNESIITSFQDNTLNDPAQGAYNFAAPGADRLRLMLELTKQSIANASNSFVELFSIKDGVVQEKFDQPQYAVLEDEFARRTFETNGNYYVKGFTSRIREHLQVDNNGGVLTLANGGNNSLLAIGIEPGIAFVQGYEINNLVTSYVTIDKGIDSVTEEQQTVSANYGRYVLVDEFVGTWPVNSDVMVSLYDTAQNAISTKVSGGTAPSGTVIGTAKLRAVVHETGEHGLSATQFRMYLFDIYLWNGSFADVRSLSYHSGSVYCKADAVLVNNVASLQEISFGTYIFPIAASNIKTIRDASDQIDTTYAFTKDFSVNIGTNGQFTLSSGASDEIFPYSTGSLNTTQIQDGFIVSLASAATVSLTGTITVTSGSAAVTGSGTSFTNLNIGDRIKITASSESYIILSITDNTHMTFTENVTTAAAGSAFAKSYLAGDVIDFTIDGGTGTARTVTAASSTSISFDMKETLSAAISATVIATLHKTDAKEIKKQIRRQRYVVIDCSTADANTVGPWPLGTSDIFRIVSIRKDTSAFTSNTQGTDVTSSFILDNGQRDTMYDHGQIRKAPGAVSLTSSDKLLVTYDYFYPDTSQGVGYFSVDSYPIDDVNGSSNTAAITTKEIPIYSSKLTGIDYSLRDCIDFRPVKSAVAADAITVATASTNPNTTPNFVVPTGGLHVPVPNEDFIADIQFYLPRKDLIIIDKKGVLRPVRGVPSVTPITPSVPSGTMGIAAISVAPYPSLPYELAIAAGRLDYADKLSNIAFRRYTMRDISVLEQRISNLEYYVNLSLLEKNTLDLKVPDADGLDRFKNGIFVDPFTDFRFSDIGNPDYSASIDKAANELRPKYVVDDVKMVYSTSSSNVTKNGTVVTLPYGNVEFIAQPYATRIRNAASQFFDFTGKVFLDPESDSWVDTTQIPDLTVTDDDAASLAAGLVNAFGTQWDSWQTISTGTEAKTSGNQVTVSTTTTQSRTGTQLTVDTTTRTQDLGNKVVDINYAPYIRSQIINFRAIGLKPNTRIYLFFDNEAMSGFIRGTDSSYNPTTGWGGNVITDSNGQLYGQFYLPSNAQFKFRCGTKLFHLVDSPNNDTATTTTVADGYFTAQGLIETQQDTILSTEVPQISGVAVNSSQTIQSSYVINLPAPPATPPAPPATPDPPPAPPPPPKGTTVTKTPPKIPPSYSPGYGGNDTGGRDTGGPGGSSGPGSGTGAGGGGGGGSK